MIITIKEKTETFVCLVLTTGEGACNPEGLISLSGYETQKPEGH